MSQKILIIDDDAALAEELADILRDNGYCVEITSDSVRGERLIREKKYDRYLLDYKMSGYNGIELLRTVKEVHADSIVFIVSGRPSIEKLLKAEGVDGLADGIIAKPFDIDDLLRKLQAFP